MFIFKKYGIVRQIQLLQAYCCLKSSYFVSQESHTQIALIIVRLFIWVKSSLILSLTYTEQPFSNNLIILPYGNFYIDSDETTEYEIKEDSMLPEPCGNYCNSIINRTPQCTVEFVDLKEIYEKVQSRAGGGSHQRVSSGIINIKATSQGQLCAINVFVERMPEAATLCGDTNGRVLLEVNHEDYFQNQVN